MEKHVSYYNSPLGVLKIEADREAVTSITFFEQTTPEDDQHPVILQCKKQLDEYFAGNRQTFEFPIQQDGTEFQQKVWSLLQQIPFGKTISYQHLSKQYGDVKAIRAVASANGKNNLAIVVPCHRVIGTNASLTGYAGGLWRKQWLLDHERKYFAGIEQSSLF